MNTGAERQPGALTRAAQLMSHALLGVMGGGATFLLCLVVLVILRAFSAPVVGAPFAVQIWSTCALAIGAGVAAAVLTQPARRLRLVYLLAHCITTVLLAALVIASQ